MVLQVEPVALDNRNARFELLSIAHLKRLCDMPNLENPAEFNRIVAECLKCSIN
jgi:hypothetical protein